MLREKIALWAIWTFLCPFLRLTVTWLKIFLDEIVDETFIVRLSVISWSKARFDPCKITKTSSRSSEAVSHKTSLSLTLINECYLNRFSELPISTLTIRQIKPETCIIEVNVCHSRAILDFADL